MRVYVVEIQEPRQEVEYHYYPTLSEALEMKPSVGPDELIDVYQDSMIRTYEIAKGLPRKQLVFGLLNGIGFAKPGSHKTLRRWDGKRWAREPGAENKQRATASCVSCNRRHRIRAAYVGYPENALCSRCEEAIGD